MSRGNERLSRRFSIVFVFIREIICFLVAVFENDEKTTTHINGSYHQ